MGNVARPAPARRGRHLKIMLWALSVIVLGTVLMPLSGYVYVAMHPAYAQAEDGQVNPRADYWRQVRREAKGYTAVKGQETNELIENGGQIWREIRNGPVATYGATLMVVALLGLVLFHVIFGKARLEGGESGRPVYRWNLFERVLHWYTAILFIILAITGLSLLYGRAVLIPVMGLQGFSVYADLAKDLHNYLGFFFIGGLIIMLALWAKESLFSKVDWEWLKKGGGYIGKGHAPAGKVNAGEKVWFWLLFVVGIVLSVTGVILNTPNFDWQRDVMQLSNLLHASAGMLLIAFAFGHIYLGTIGNEKAFWGMWNGYVDANWAKQHHSLWYEDEVKKGKGPVEEQPGVVKEKPV